MIDAKGEFLQHEATWGPQESVARRVARKTKKVGVRLRVLYFRQCVLELQAIAPNMLALNFRGLVRATPTLTGAAGCFAAESAGLTRRFVAAIGAAAVLLSLPACTSSKSYMGIPLVAGHANPELQSLAARARAGDKQAQLDLGIRFEEGNGVPRDTKRAMKLYRQAAQASGGRIWVYSPSPGNGAPARVVPVDTGPKREGLEEAKDRLLLLSISNGERVQ